MLLAVLIHPRPFHIKSITQTFHEIPNDCMQNDFYDTKNDYFTTCNALWGQVADALWDKYYCIVGNNYSVFHCRHGFPSRKRHEVILKQTIKNLGGRRTILWTILRMSLFEKLPSLWFPILKTWWKQNRQLTSWVQSLTPFRVSLICAWPLIWLISILYWLFHKMTTSIKVVDRGLVHSRVLSYFRH